MRKLFVVALVYASLGFISCENDETGFGVNEKLASDEVLLPVYPANTANSYDSVGQIHNTMLQSCRVDVLSLYKRNGNITVAEANDIAQNTLHRAGYDTTLFKYNDLCTLLSDTATIFRNYISASRLSTKGKDIMCSTISLMDSLARNEVDNYMAYKAIIVNTEQFINEDRTIDNQEKSILLSAMSVLRYSLYYWSLTENYLIDNNTKAKKMPKWVRITMMAVADAAGGIGGALTGAAVGTTVGGPAGSVAGGVAGSITGAITASNGAATLCDNIDKISEDEKPKDDGNKNNN